MKQVVATIGIILFLSGCRHTVTTDDGKHLVFDAKKNLVIEEPACPFLFGTDVRRIVIPIVKEKLARSSEAFDLEHPGMTYYRDHAVLSFEPKPSNGPVASYPVDAQILNVEIGVCDHKVQKVYFEIPGQ